MKPAGGQLKQMDPAPGKCKRASKQLFLGIDWGTLPKEVLFFQEFRTRFFPLTIIKLRAFFWTLVVMTTNTSQDRLAH